MCDLSKLSIKDLINITQDNSIREIKYINCYHEALKIIAYGKQIHVTILNIVLNDVSDLIQFIDNPYLQTLYIEVNDDLKHQYTPILGEAFKENYNIVEFKGLPRAWDILFKQVFDRNRKIRERKNQRGQGNEDVTVEDITAYLEEERNRKYERFHFVNK